MADEHALELAAHETQHEISTFEDETDLDGAPRQPAIPASKSVHRCTPQPVLDLVYEVLGCPVGIDPCSNPRSIVKAHRTVMLPEDGLSVPWHEYRTGYVNPPFGKVDEPRWIRKAIEEAQLGWEGILLLPSKTGAPWFDPLYEASPAICFWGSAELDVEGRIWFHEEDGGATFNTEFIYLGPRYEAFARAFSRAGKMIYPQHDRALTARITGRTMRAVYAPGATEDLFQRAKRCEREIRSTRYHGVAVGVLNLPEQTTVREVLASQDMPELRSIIEDLTLHELGQALLLLSNEAPVVPPATTRGKKTLRELAPPEVDKRQLGLPVHADGKAYRTDAERARFDQRVFDTIRQSKDPMARIDIMRLCPCTEHEYRGAISRLQNAGTIERVGDGRHARYRAANQPPRTEQDDHPTPPPHDHTTAPSPEPGGDGEDLGGVGTAPS